MKIFISLFGIRYNITVISRGKKLHWFSATKMENSLDHHKFSWIGSGLLTEGLIRRNTFTFDEWDRRWELLCNESLSLSVGAFNVRRASDPSWSELHHCDSSMTNELPEIRAGTTYCESDNADDMPALVDIGSNPKK